MKKAITPSRIIEANIMDLNLLGHILSCFVVSYLYLLIPTVLSNLLQVVYKDTSVGEEGQLFVLNFLWLMLSVIIWANFSTRGETILNGIIVLIGLALLLFRKKMAGQFQIRLSTKRRKLYQNFGKLAIWLVIIFLVRIVFYFDNQIGFFSMSVGDLAIYTKSALSVFSVGKESIDFGLFEASYRAPYHYFDIWLNSMFGEILNYNSSVILGVSGSVLLVIAAMGFDTINSQFELKVPSWTALIVLFYAGFYLNSWDSHDKFHFVQMYCLDIFSNPRHCVVLLLFILSFIFKKIYSLSILVLLLIPFVSIVPSIGIAFFVTLSLLERWGRLGFKAVQKTLILGLLALILMLYYHYSWLSNPISLTATGTEVLLDLGLRDIFYKMRWLVIRFAVGHFIVVGIILLCLKFLSAKALKLILGIFTAVFMCSILSILGSDGNSFQYFTNVLVPLLPLALFLGFIVLLNKMKMHFFGVMILFVCISLFQVPSYINAIDSITQIKSRFNEEFVNDVYDTVISDGGLVHVGGLVNQEFIKEHTGPKSFEGSYSFGLWMIKYNFDNCILVQGMNLADIVDVENEHETDWFEKNKLYNPYSKAGFSRESNSGVELPDYILADSSQIDIYFESLLVRYQLVATSMDDQFLFYTK